MEIVENGVRYLVDVKDGQKTGFFLDQKYNRLAVQNLCRRLPAPKVLDCFTHTGSFALNAGLAGAASVLGVDASDLAVEQAGKNAALNGLSERVRFQCADVFDLLPRLTQEGERYDVVILDPPAFTKSRNSVSQAVKGYREINLRGLKLVKKRRLPGHLLLLPLHDTGALCQRPSGKPLEGLTKSCARWNTGLRRRITRFCGRRMSPII